jgi:nitroimidazol reductase NimA-like FMN-containing flavoprotein (pyridoxamine 5'-phosphate oxidase superfamily)
MTTTSEQIAILSVSECWDLLENVALGRLVTTVGGQAHIFPVNFVVQGRSVLFRTAEGTKLVSVAINNQVLFEADDHNDAEGWSVIINGTTRTLRTVEEIEDAERTQLRPWVAGCKTHYVRVVPTSITGRRFRFDTERG